MDEIEKRMICKLIELRLLLNLFMRNNVNIEKKVEEIKNLIFELYVENDALTKEDLKRFQHLNDYDKDQLMEFINKNLDHYNFNY